jgi:hypothetical protein
MVPQNTYSLVEYIPQYTHEKDEFQMQKNAIRNGE